MKNASLFVLVLGTLLGLAGWTAHVQRSTPVGQTWEYQELELSATESAEPTLNRLGAQGWELIGVTSACPSSPSDVLACRYWAYLKRAQ